MPRARRRPASSGATPWLVGGALGIAAAAAFFAFSGGSEEASPSPAPAAVPAPEPEREDPRAKLLTEAKRWYWGSCFDKSGRRLDLDGKTIAALARVAEERGYAPLPEFGWAEKKAELFTDALARDRDDPEANRAAGRVPLSDYPDFFAVFRKMADAKALPREFAVFRNRHEGRIRYGSDPRAPALEQAEYAKAKRLLDRYVAFDKRMREHPTEQAIFEARERIRIDPLLGDYETVHIEVPPFVLFYASKALVARDESEEEERRVQEEARRLQERLGSFKDLIGDHLAFFRERWVGPLGLPEFQPRELLFVWVFADRATFDEYGDKHGLKAPPSILGYFSPQSHWVFLYEDETQRSTTEVTLSHELTHQLHWHFSKDPKEPGLNHFQRGKSVWFSEGWAEYVGWCRNEGGTFRFGQDSPGRLNVFHACRKSNLPVFPLRLILKPWNYIEWMRDVRTWYRNHWQEKTNIRWEQVPDLYFSMLYSEGWLFTKFLYEYGDGKYRDAVMEYTKGALRGFERYKVKGKPASPAQVFSWLMKLKTDEDWERLQKEFDGYLEEMLEKYPAKE